MAITGFTGTAQFDDSTAAEQISPKYVPTAYPRAVLDAFVAAFDGYEFLTGTLVKSIPRMGSLSAAALTEGTNADPTALSDSQRNGTISEHGVGVAYGDMLDVANSSPGGRERVINLMKRAYQDRVDSQLLTLNTSFTDQVGVSASNLTLSVILQAIHELEENDADGPFMSFQHTSAIHIIRTLVGGASASTGPVFQREGVLSRIGPAMNTGYAMTLFEVDFFTARNCPLNSSSTDRIGVMLPMNALHFPFRRLIGVPAEGPFQGVPWDGRITEERDESGRLTELWCTGLWVTMLAALDYGVGMIQVDAHA